MSDRLDAAAQYVLDTEARFVEGTRSAQDVKDAWLVFRDLLEETVGPEHKRVTWANNCANSYASLEKHPEHVLTTLFGYCRTFSIGDTTSHRHLRTARLSWIPYDLSSRALSI